MEIGTCQFVVKKQLDIGGIVEYVKQGFVETCSVNGKYSLERMSVLYWQSVCSLASEASTYSTLHIVILGLLLEVPFGVHAMNHAPSHGDSSRHNIAEEIRRLSLSQGLDAAL